MKLKIRISIVLFSLFIIVPLTSCSVLSEAERMMEDFQETAREIEIGLENGLALLETGEAFATQIADSEIIQTAKALSTSFEGSGLIATAQSIASGDGSALLQTAQYFATHQVPKIQETVKAIATRVPIPGDIPIFPGKRTDLFYEQDEIRYKVEANIEDVFNFYEDKMPILGWEHSEDDVRIGSDNAVVIYKKADQRAILWLNIDQYKKFTVVRISFSHE